LAERFSPEIFTYQPDFTYPPNFHLSAGRHEKYALIGQLKQDLEFIIKLKVGQNKNFG
jgi:hypothetical protein